MSSFVQGLFGKFAEGTGAGLAGVIVGLGIIMLFDPFKNETIVRVTEPKTSCDANELKRNTRQCIVKVDCDKETEIAVSGQCIVRQANGQRPYLMNFGITRIKGQANNPSRFECNWGIVNDADIKIEPEVTANCIKRSQFQFSKESIEHLPETFRAH